MVLAYIDKHGSIKRAGVMDLCRITKDQAYKLLKRLKSSGQIAHSDRKSEGGRLWARTEIIALGAYI